MAFDLENLPPPQIVETLDYEAILAAMLADLQTRWPGFTALLESDPAFKLLEVWAYRELLWRQRLNDVAKSRFVAFATGADLDHLAAFYGLERQPSESDNDFRQRVRLWLWGSSSAGPAEWYKFHAKSAHADVAQIGVDSPSGGHVRITVLGKTETGAPSQETLDAVRDAILNPRVAALCHTVSVVPVEVVPVNVTAALILRTDAPADDEAIAQVATALRAALVVGRHLGQDVTISWLMATMRLEFVHDVTIAAPLTSVAISGHQSPIIGDLALSVAGRV